VAEIHVPNASTIFDAFVRGTDQTKWALIGSGLFGMYGGPEVRGPQDLHTEANTADHKAIYDFALLSSVLLQAGFAEVEDVTCTVKDRHDEAWLRSSVT
jgi:hypothetical protein